MKPAPLNRKRVQSAQHALKHYARYKGTDPENVVRDLLADLMHLCHQNPDTYGEFSDELRIGQMHFDAEKVDQVTA